MKAIDNLIKLDEIRPFNGLILIAQGGNIVYKKAQGTANFENKEQFEFTDQFIIGSLSKQITAVLMLKTIEEGKLKLNEKLINYIPKLPYHWEENITLHQLLNHTHGIMNAEKPLMFKPGTNFSYSNIGYVILAQLIEMSHDKPFGELVHKLFLQYDMNSSYVPHKQFPGNLINSYYYNASGELVPAPRKLIDDFIPSSFLVSNINDLFRWNELLHNGHLLSNRSYEQMINVSAQFNSHLFGHSGYGYGLRISKEDNVLEYFHTGHICGFISLLSYFPATKTSLIVWENIAWSNQNLISTFHYELLIRKFLRDEKFIF